MTINLAYATGTAVTITNTEMSLGVTGGTTTGVPVARTDAGMFCLHLDGVANMVKGDEYQIKFYEIARSGGTVRTIFSARIKHAQAETWISPLLLLGVGWDITAQRISATSRAFDWSVRRVN